MDKCWAACVPLTVALLGWLQLPQSLPEELGYKPPQLTVLNASGWEELPWPPGVKFSAAQRANFTRHGFIPVRNFLSPVLVREMLRVHGHWCHQGAFSPHWHCKNEDVWARTNVYRDFLYYSPLGASIRNLLQVDGIRVYGDHITEMRREHPGIFYHFDNLYYGGVLGEFHAQSRGAIVFLFLTGVNRDTTGGSVLVQPGGHRNECVKAGVDPELQASCRKRFYERAIALNFNPGDALVIHPLLPHASQGPLPTVRPNFRRITYLVRLVEADAIFCGTDTQVRETGKVDCRHHLRPGEKAHHVCYQQIHPLLEEEVLQRLGSDWFRSTCNVQKDWRYTGPKRLRLWARGLISQLRIRLSGRAPVGLERAECVFPP